MIDKDIFLQKNIFNEINIMKQLKHNNIVEFKEML